MKHLITLLLIGYASISLFAQSNGLKFDGSTLTSSADRVATEYIGIPDSAARTVEMWIKRGTTGTAQGIFSEWGQTGGGNGVRFTVKVQNNHLRVETGGSGTQYSLEGTTFLSSNTWYHVAAVIDPALTTDRVKLYINGNLEASGYLFLNTDTSMVAPVHIGTRFNGVGGFNGAIDDYRIWNVARTQTEIQDNMNAELCTYPASLVSYFKFNEGVAGGNNTAISTVLDEINPTNNNVLTNMSLTGTLSNFVVGTIDNATDLTVETVTSCTPYTWAENSTLYSTSGTYDVLYTNAAGCDSIVRLELTIPTIDNTVTNNMDGTLTANMAGATYQWLDCNNTNAPISGATSQTYLATAAGSYAVEITSQTCMDTSVCEVVASAPSYVNPALDFDGVNDFISTNNPGLSGNAARTVEAWIKVPASNTTTQHVIADWGSVATGGRFTVNVLSNKLRLEVLGGGITGNALLNDDVWHHIAVTYDPSDNDTVRLYVDGIQDASSRLGVSINTGTTTNFRIGGRIDNANYFFGSIDEVRLWNVAKSQAQIAAGMTNSICTYAADLVAYFPLNSGTPFANNTSVTNETDFAQFDLTSGTLNGFTLDGAASNYVIGTTLEETFNFSKQTETACGSFTWSENSMNYVTSGVYMNTLTNVNTCDSLVILDLTINAMPDVTVTDNGNGSITANASSVTYQWLDCNTMNSEISGATSQTFLAPATGNYAVEITTPESCVDTSICTAITINPYSTNNASLNFDGATDYVTTSNPGVLGNNPITIEAWVKDANLNNEEVIAAWGSDAVNGARFTFRLNAVGANHVARIEIKGGGINGTIPVNDGNWHHVAVSYDPSATNKYKLYVDGVLDVEGNLTQALNIIGDNPVRIGRRLNPAFAGYFAGDMDELRIWDVARTQTEIQTNMFTELCTTPASLIAYYSFNEGTPNADNTAVPNVFDYTLSGNNGNFETFDLIGTASNYVAGSPVTTGLNATIQTVEACSNYTWAENSTMYTTSGIYSSVYTNGGGCDSLVVLDLTINQPTTTTQTIANCGDYTWSATGLTYATSGQYTTTLLGSNGCDSTITLDLTINQAVTGTDVQTACGSFLWIDGNTYSTNNNTATHTLVGGAANGCDSIVTLDLTVLMPATGTDVQSACGSYDWIDGNTYTSNNNTATHTLVGGAANGCDSIVTLDLTILSPASGVDTQSACGSFTWIDGNTYTSNNNTASFTLVGAAANGCDSIVTLDLTITTVPAVATDNGDATLTAAPAGMSYQWYNCDLGTSIANETDIMYVAATNGNYAVIVNDGTCADTSDCVYIGNVGLNSLALETMHVAPNPFGSTTTISFGSPITGQLIIRDMQGRLIQQQTLNNTTTYLVNLIDEPKGMYFVELHTEQAAETIRIIKN